MLHSEAYGAGQSAALTKLAMGNRQYLSMMRAVRRMAGRLGGNAPQALEALQKGGPVPTHLAQDADRIRGMLAGGGTGAGWKDLARSVGNEKLVKDKFSLLPRDGPDTALTTLAPDRLGKPVARFSDFVRESKGGGMTGTGWGPNGYVNSENLRAKGPVPPMWDPVSKALYAGNADVARGEFLRANPAARYTRRPESDLATALHMPKGGMFLPRGGKRGGIPFDHEIGPGNELQHVGAGRGAYFFRGGGNVNGPDTHSFLSGNAAVAKYYSRGLDGGQSIVHQGARPVTNSSRLPAPNLMQWYKNTVGLTPHGQQLPTRTHGALPQGTRGMSYDKIVRDGQAYGSHSSGIDGLQSYQVDFPTKNLGPKQRQVPRGLTHAYGKEQVDRFGLQPHENAAGFGYDTPQGTYIMKGRGAFEKDFHTIDGRRAAMQAGKTEPRNSPLPLPIYRGQN